MAERRVGITITAKDLASRSFRGVGTSAKLAGKSVQATGKAIENTASAAGRAAEVWNQGLELARKGMELYRMAVVDTTDAALRFRSEGDAAVEFFAKQRKEAELMQARVGDVILPIWQGLAEGIRGGGESTAELVKQNKSLIQSGILSFLQSMAGGLDKLIAAVGFLSTAWLGLKGVFFIVQAAARAWISLVISGVSSALGLVGMLARHFGKEGLAADIELARKEADVASEAFAAMADDSLGELEKIPAELKKQEESFVSLRATVAETARVAIDSARKRAAADKGGMDQTREAAAAQALEQIASIERVKAAAQAAHDAQVLAMANEAAMLRANMNEALAAQQKQATAAVAFGQQISDSLVGAWMAAAQAGKTATETFADVARSVLSTTMSLVKQQVMLHSAAAVSAASPGIAAAFGPAAPVMIPIIGGAIVSVLEAGLNAALGGSRPFALGGEVKGGVAGKDSVPAILKPGEMVLTTEETRRAKRLAPDVFGRSGPNVVERARRTGEALERFKLGGTVGREGPTSGGPVAPRSVNVTVNATAQAFDLPDAARRKKWLRDMSRDAEAAIKDGTFLPGLRGLARA